MLGSSREQCAAYTAAAVPGENRQPELRRIAAERDMHDTRERELVVIHAQDGVVIEVDALDILRDGRRPECGPEAQPDIFGRQPQEVLQQPGPYGFGQALNMNAHGWCLA